MYWENNKYGKRIIIDNTVYAEIFARRKFLPISSSALIGEIFIAHNFLSRANDYIEDMATFATLAKIYSTKYFCNTKVARLGETCPAKILLYTVI